MIATFLLGTAVVLLLALAAYAWFDGDTGITIRRHMAAGVPFLRAVWLWWLEYYPQKIRS